MNGKLFEQYEPRDATDVAASEGKDVGRAGGAVMASCYGTVEKALK